MKHKVLLHCCCAPCSSAIIEWMLANGEQPVLFYSNPNIYPEEEYMIRRNECVRYAGKLGLEIRNYELAQRIIRRKTREK